MSLFTLYIIWYVFHDIIYTKTKAEDHKHVSKRHDEDVLNQRLKFMSVLTCFINLCDPFDD